jgi:hypothetical protein
MGKPERERSLGKHRRRWKKNTEVDLREIECDGIDWIHLPPDRDQWKAFVNTLMNFRIL